MGKGFISISESCLATGRAESVWSTVGEPILISAATVSTTGISVTK